MSGDRIVVPTELATFAVRFRGEMGHAWIEALPDLVHRYLRHWRLRRDGSPRHGMVALVLPVRADDGSPAALKLQLLDEEHLGEATALRVWDGDGAVRLLDEDPETGTLLLERLDPDRSLASEPDELTAVRVIAGLLVRLNRYPAPPDIRRLGDVADRMIAAVPAAATALPDIGQARLLRDWAAATGEVAGEAGHQLLHWDLHYDNVLAGTREPWLAIDPKPLAGDPGFELLPALHNRWDDVVASGHPARAVRRRFDVMVEAMGLDRQRAVHWTLARVLQNALWDIEDGASGLDPVQVLIASAITGG